MSKQLTRLPNDRVIFGICSGIAQYLELDKTIVRIIMVLLFFCSFFLVGILYIIAYFIMPVDPYSGGSNPDIIK